MKLRCLSSFLLLLSAPLFAATFVVPEDKVLIDRADAVVLGVVQTSESRVTAGNGIVTVTELLVSDVLKGHGIVVGELVSIREPGGETETISLVLHGVPRYEPGDRVMVMLSRDEHSGMWRTHEYALGKFRYIHDDFGRSFLVRDRENICGWAPGFTPHRERARKMDPFVDYVRAVVRGANPVADYLVDFDEVCVATSQPESTPAYAPVTAFEASDYLTLCNCRWKNGGTATFESTGSQGGYTDSRADASVGMSAWNSHGSSTINYSLGGTGGGTAGFKGGNDDINSVIFEDPSDEVNGTGCFDGSGVLAIGGIHASITKHTFSGEEFNNLFEGDVVIDCGVNPTNGITQSLFQSLLGHELGHTLGFRHSADSTDGGVDLETNALMARSLGDGPGNASLLAWDSRAAAAAYGPDVCTPVSISTHPQSTSISKGSSADLSVSTTGPGPSYQWYRGTSGDTSDPVGTDSASFNTGALTATTDFWVRVSNCTSDTADSNTATVTVTCEFSISPHPQSVAIESGTSTLLTVGTNPTPGSGGATYSYEWFQGTSGNTSIPVGSNQSSFQTPSLTEQTSYWVRVTRTDCEPDVMKNSNTAVVSICTPPLITQHPQDATVQSGSGTTLSVVASGSAPLAYQWYRDVGGNNFQAIFNQKSSSFNTGALTSSQQYRVVVSNGCGAQQSNVATVTVTTSCTRPAITGQPASTSIDEGATTTLSVTATGTSLAYQWFEGSSGDTTKPVGTNAPAFTTPSLTATTSYWVRVTNSCGGVFSETATVTVIRDCPPGRLCFLNGRFELSLAVRDHRTDTTGTGVPLQENDLFGFFSIPEFTGDPNNPEVFVKMLDGRVVNGKFWVFYGGLTDLEYTLTVDDTVAGTSKSYFKMGGTSNGGFDVGSGVVAESCPGQVPGTPAGVEAPTICSAGPSHLCLNSERFRVELTARDQRTGNTADGVSIPQGDIFGYFALPGLTNDPNNPEVFVKMVDGRVVNNFFWVFHGSLTDFEYTLTVIDTFTGERKSYTKDPGSACGAFDTQAF